MITQQTTSLAQAPIPPSEQERKRQMAEAWKAYKGEFPKPLKVDADQPDDNVTSNRCAPIVDKGTSFLFGQVVKIEASDEATTDETEIQDFIHGLWGDDDDRMTLLSKVAINGGSFGQAFIKLIPAQGRMKYPRLVNLDPRLIRIVTHPEDCDLHLAYIIEYSSSNDFQNRQIIARVDPQNDLDVIGPYDYQDYWTITNYTRRGSAGSWFQVGIPEEWMWPFPPIFTCQNLPNPNEPYGASDLTPDLINLNKALNFLLSILLRIAKYHGHPKTIAKGVQASQLQIAINDVLCLPSADSDITTLTPMENFAGLLSIVANLMSNMDEQSRVPAVALGRQTDMPKGNISGVALALLFQPLIEKTIQKQRLYGKLIREVTRAALVLSGFIPVEAFEDYKIDLRWQNLLPIDNLASAQEAKLLEALGVSVSTLLQQLGYNPEEEMKKKQKEDEQKMTNFSRGVGMPPTVPPPTTQLQQQEAVP